MTRWKNRPLILILTLGLAVRLIDIAKPFSGVYKWNEGHYAVTALNYFRYGLSLSMNEYGLDLTTPPLYTWLIHLSFRVFGVHEWAARLPSLFFGVLSLILVYHIAKQLYDGQVALAATFIAAIAPGIIYFSRNVQLESMFTAFALAALLFVLRYRESGDVKWLAASGIYLSIAVLAKYPAVLAYPALLWVWLERRELRERAGERVRLFLYLLLPLLPSLLWVFYAMSVNPGLTTWYFHKPEAPWTLQSAFTALHMALSTFIPEHFGSLFYYPFIVLLPFILARWRDHGTALLFTAPWLLLITLYPEFYLKNSYYHYPMLYGMAMLLGYSAVDIGRWLEERSDLNGKALGAFALLLALALSLYQYNVYFHSYYTDFSKANETEPFQSAKYVAEVNTAHELVVVDFPMTMFYAGGDPAYVRPAYYTDGILEAIQEDRYPYFVIYYSGNASVREALERHNYTQIAPRAWYKNMSGAQNQASDRAPRIIPP